jgi:DNA/RNA non-specific endonuclease
MRAVLSEHRDAAEREPTSDQAAAPGSPAGATLSVATVLRMQQEAGNAAVARMLGAGSTRGALIQRSFEEEGSPGHRPNLDVGDTGPGVALLQRRLGVPVTSTFDATTHDAAVAYQKARPSLHPATGGVGPLTWASLDADAASGASPAATRLRPSLSGPITVGGLALGLGGYTAVDQITDAEVKALIDQAIRNGAARLAARGAVEVGGKVVPEATAVLETAAPAAGGAGGAGAGGGALAAVAAVAVGAIVVAGTILVVAHVVSEAKQLDEFGGDLPPGGLPPRRRGECPRCETVPPGTIPDYGAVDDFLRPRGVSAILKAMPGIGTDADARITPPGWTGGGRDSAGQARTHLLGKALGGSGSEARNLVTFERGANLRMFAEFEKDVREIVITMPTDCFEYSVTPEYLSTPKSPTDRSNLMPHRIRASLTNLCTGEVPINGRTVDNLLPH